MNRNVINSLLVLFLLVFNISCNDNDNNIQECEDVLCTLEFVMIDVSVTDNTGNPIFLDAFQVIDIATGEDMTIALTGSELLQAQQSGIYPLITDGILGVNQQRQLQFIGIQRDQEVLREDFVVASDCCHVSLVSGDLQIKI